MLVRPLSRTDEVTEDKHGSCLEDPICSSVLEDPICSSVLFSRTDEVIDDEHVSHV